MNILITGAASGMQRKTIEKIKNKNVHIFVTVHTEKQLELVQTKYSTDPNITCLKIDITNKKDYVQLYNIDIDVLICNAAIGEGGSMIEIDMQRVRHNFEINVFRHFEIIQIVLKKMMRKGAGRIILMSSLAALVPIPFLGGYCATKASILKMCESLQMEMSLLSKKIHIICVLPGLYDTGFNRVMLENKYPFMEKETYFKEELEFIRKREDIFLSLFERRNMYTIVKQLKHAIFDKKPKKIYKAPFMQSIGAKIYLLFLE